MLEKNTYIQIFLSCSDLKSRNKASTVWIGGGVEDERLDAGHCVEAGEHEHEGEPKEEHIQLFHLEKHIEEEKHINQEKKHIEERNGEETFAEKYVKRTYKKNTTIRVIH